MHRTSNWLLPCLALLAWFSLPLAAAAQTRNPQLELFGGYAMMRPDAREFRPMLNNVMGWGFSATNKLYRGLGITFDSGGFYRKVESSTSNTRASAYSFMAGPTVRFPSRKAVPYIHLLAGIGLLTGKTTSSTGTSPFQEHAFVGAAGGGLDIPIARFASIRVIEADYFPAHHETGGNFHNIRWRSGIVFNIGADR